MGAQAGLPHPGSWGTPVGPKHWGDPGGHSPQGHGGHVRRGRWWGWKQPQVLSWPPTSCLWHGVSALNLGQQEPQCQSPPWGRRAHSPHTPTRWAGSPALSALLVGPRAPLRTHADRRHGLPAAGSWALFHPPSCPARDGCSLPSLHSQEVGGHGRARVCGLNKWAAGTVCPAGACPQAPAHSRAPAPLCGALHSGDQRRNESQGTRTHGAEGSQGVPIGRAGRRGWRRTHLTLVLVQMMYSISSE